MNSNFSHLPMVGGITFPLLTTNELSPLRRDVKWSIRGGHIVYRFPRWSNKSPLIGSLRGTPGVLYHSILFLPGFIHSKKLPLTLSGGGKKWSLHYIQPRIGGKMWETFPSHRRGKVGKGIIPYLELPWHFDKSKKNGHNLLTIRNFFYQLT
jgi:hypothetical protein